jgi:hypothetical protein
VLWHEPFGLAVIESLYFGCPVFATPYGALPELVPQGCGVLSASRTANLPKRCGNPRFDAQACHRHAVAHFSAGAMAQGYLEKYARILDGEVLNAGRSGDDGQPQSPALAEITRRLPAEPARRSQSRGFFRRA